jgi:hypothetical protein
MANRDFQAELELYKEAFFTKDNNKLIEFYRPWFRSIISFADCSDTLYILACRFGNPDAISLLYKLGDQTYNSKTTSIGCSPLDLAIQYQNKECIQALLEIPEYQQIGRYTFMGIAIYCDNDDAYTYMIVEAAFRIHKIDYFEYPNTVSAPKLSRILCAVRGDQQDNVDEDDVLRIRYRVFFSRSLTSRLLLKI